VLIFRLNAPVYYANALSVRAGVEQRIEAQEAPPRTVVLDLSVQDSLDITSAEMFAKLVAKLQQAGIEVVVAEVHAPVLAFARKSGLLAHLGPERIFPTVDAAMDALADPDPPSPQTVTATGDL
jgi:MFS superfamily sulfate permease-like transporter